MDNSDIRARIVDAVRLTLEEGGLRALRLPEIARRAGLDLAALHAIASTPQAALRLALTHIDDQVLAEGPADGTDSARDRLFEIMMRRYDALVPWRGALQLMMRSLPPDPFSAIGLALAVERSMGAMLEAAGISATGLAGGLRVRGLCLVHADVLRQFIDDDTADLAATMKALDTRLKQVERFAPLLDRFDHLPRTAAKHAGSSIRQDKPQTSVGDDAIVM